MSINTFYFFRYWVNITGGRQSHPVLTATSQSNRNGQTSTPHKQNPLTDYDKTLHNWLRPRDEHVTQNLCQSAARERLAKHVKYKASSFLFLFLLMYKTAVYTLVNGVITHQNS